MSVCRSVETPSVCGETETEALRGHKRADDVKGGAFDSLEANRVWHQQSDHERNHWLEASLIINWQLPFSNISPVYKLVVSEHKSFDWGYDLMLHVSIQYSG